MCIRDRAWFLAKGVDAMSHQALYRKWRPITFDDVVGQEHITAALRAQVEARCV